MEYSATLESTEKSLRRYELGGLVLDAYDLAREVDPRLHSVKFLPYDLDNDNMLAHTTGKRSEISQGIYTVRLRLDETDIVRHSYQEMAQKHPLLLTLTADRMQLAQSQLAFHAFYVFVTLHELGHVSEFWDLGNNFDAINATVRANHAALPCPSMVPSKLANLDLDTQATLTQRHGFGSFVELMDQQIRAYKNLPIEADADHFASEVLADNPSFLEMLLEVTPDNPILHA